MPTKSTITDITTTFLLTTASSSSPPTTASIRQGLTVFIRYLISRKPPLNPKTCTQIDLTPQIFTDFLNHLQNTYTFETEHAYSRAVLQMLSHVATTPNQLQQLSEFHTLIDQKRRKKQHHPINIPSPLIANIRDTITTITLPTDPPPSTEDKLRLPRDKALILTLIDTGLKPSQLCNLSIDAFDHHANTLLHDNHSLPITTLTSRHLNTYLHERLAKDTIQRHLPYESLPLFSRHDKRAGTRTLPISRWTVANIVTHWTAIFQTDPAATTRITPTTLRHYFVATTLSTTQDVTITQARARHKDVSTTRRYLHSGGHTIKKTISHTD